MTATPTKSAGPKQESLPGFDPVALEIHRKALENLTNEMGLTLIRTSGSPVVTEAKDFATCLLDTGPEQLALSSTVFLHAASSLIGTRQIADQLRQDAVEPRPGDGWIANDPYQSGAMHQADIGIISPLFYGDQHVAWAFSNLHVLDIGGLAVSGFAPGARTMYEEALRFPALRIIRDGQLDSVWEAFIAANVRAPEPVVNDIRSMIAANNVAEQKLAAIIDRFGMSRHEEYCAIAKDLTEQTLRRRIEQLPDGKYRTVEWVQLDRAGERAELLDIEASLEVEGSELKFSFSGPPQVESVLNATLSSVQGWTMSAILTRLGYGDLPFNAGMWRALTFDVGEQGSILNPLPPAPVSNSHGGASRATAKAAESLLSQALARSTDPTLRSRVAGGCPNTPAWAGLFGRNQFGAPSVVFHLDTMSGVGGPAQTVSDGLDGYGSTCMSGCGISNIETHEAMQPVLFLWRRVSPNSGGPGQFRGGQGLEQAYVIRYTDSLAGYAIAFGTEPTARGFGGGYPGSASHLELLSDSNIEALIAAGEHPDLSNVSGRSDLVLGMRGDVVVRRGDVLWFVIGGGSGLGDPLLRAPDLVARDMRDGYITGKHAKTAYGVVLTSTGEADAEATERRRADIRRERIGSEPKGDLLPPETPGVAVRSVGSDETLAWVCGHCGAELCAGADDWRTGAVQRVHPIVDRLTELDLRAYATDAASAVMIQELYCPACAAALGSEPATEGSGAPAA